MTGPVSEPRPAGPDDVDAVHRLIQLAIDAAYPGVYPPRALAFFRDFHSRDGILGRLEDGEVLVVESEGVPVGTGAIVGDEVVGVFVHPGYQGLGIGRRVMDALEASALRHGSDTVRLSVSLPSRGFYEKLGYSVVSHEFYDVGEGESLEYWEAEKRLGAATGV